jgi:hypothetical protein
LGNTYVAHDGLRLCIIVTQRDSFLLCQRGIPLAGRAIPTSASFLRGQDMLYSRLNYVYFIILKKCARKQNDRVALLGSRG